MNTAQEVDMEKALKICGGTQELFKDLFEIILRAIPERIELLETLAEDLQWEDLDFQAHKLKGALRNVCALESVELCAELEEKVKAKDIVQAKSVIQTLDHACKRLESWYKNGLWKAAFLPDEGILSDSNSGA